METYVKENCVSILEKKILLSLINALLLKMST